MLNNCLALVLQMVTHHSYLALLLEACATFDTRCDLPGKQKRAVYTTAISGNNLDEPYDPVDDAGYTAYAVDTTISEIMVNVTDSIQFSGKSGKRSQGSGQITYSEWVKMTKEEQDAAFAKRNQERMFKAGGNLKPFPLIDAPTCMILKLMLTLIALLTTLSQSMKLILMNLAIVTRTMTMVWSCLPTWLDKSHHVEMFVKFWNQNRHLISRRNVWRMRVLLLQARLQLMVLLTICTREKPSIFKGISIQYTWQSAIIAWDNMLSVIWNTL
jgi:hypothetical protein